MGQCARGQPDGIVQAVGIGKVRQSLIAGQPWPVTTAMGMDPRPLLRFRDPVQSLADRLAEGATTIITPETTTPIDSFEDPIDSNESITT